MFLAVHTASHQNQNYSGSSDPVPLKTGSLISSYMWAIVDLGGVGGGLEVGKGGTYWGRLTCDRNTRTRVNFRLRWVLKGNRSALRGYRRVSNRRGFFGLWICGIYRGMLGMLTLGIGSKISLVPFATSQQTTLLVEGIFTCKHRLVILNLTVWFNEQYTFFSQ